MCYKDLLFDRNLDRWLTIYDRNSLRLFEDLIAVGYEANIFISDMSISLYNFGHLKRNELKFLIPEEFEYIDEEYYEGINNNIIDKCIIRVDQDNYSLKYKRKIDTKRLLEYWFLNKNIDKACECEAFYYYLEHDIESLIDMATFVDLHHMGPLALLLDLNHNINFNIYVQVEYFLKSVDQQTKDAFYKCREIFLSDIENELNKELVNKQKKRGY